MSVCGPRKLALRRQRRTGFMANWHSPNARRDRALSGPRALPIPSDAQITSNQPATLTPRMTAEGRSISTRFALLENLIKLSMYENILFPGANLGRWQMSTAERIAMTGILARLKPKGALEVGVYFGGSLSLTAQFSQRVIGIDIDPRVKYRVKC